MVLKRTLITPSEEEDDDEGRRVYFFFWAAGFLAAGFAFVGVFFGLGARGLVAFFAFDGDLAAFAVGFPAAFFFGFSAAGFLAFFAGGADLLLSFGADLLVAPDADVAAPAAFLPAGFTAFFTLFLAPVAFFALVAEAAGATFSFLVWELSLKDPDAPFPLVCTRVPEVTAAFRYFLMKGESFSASAL